MLVVVSTCDCLRSASLRDLIGEVRRRCRDRAERALIRAGDCVIDPVGSTAVWRGRRVALRPRELDVLLALAAAHPTGLTADDLWRLVWRRPEGEGDPHQARVYVHHLRRSLPGLVQHTGHRYRLAAAERRGAVA